MPWLNSAGKGARDDVEALHAIIDRCDASTCCPILMPRARANTPGEHHRAHLIGDSAKDVRGCRSIDSQHVHHARARLSEVVERWLRAVGTFLSISRCARVDDFRIMLLERLIAESQPGGHAFAEVLHENIALRHEAINDFARFRLFQIKRDALFVFVVGLEVEIAPAFVGRSPGDRGQRASRIALVALLDLYDLGAQVGEHLRGNRPLLPYCPI